MPKYAMSITGNLFAPKSDTLDRHELPAHVRACASDADALARAIAHSVRAGKLRVQVRDDTTKRFNGREVTLADGTSGRMRGKTGLTVQGEIEFVWDEPKK